MDLTTDQGQMIDTQYLVTCCGMLSAPLIDAVSRAGDVQGASCSTPACGRRTRSISPGKRVGVVGIGATGIQVIQTIADQVDHLTVFVRTPQYVLPMKNPKYTPDDQEAYKSKFDVARRSACRTLSRGFEHDFENVWADLTPAQRRAVLEEIWEDGSLKFWLASFGEMFFDADVSEQISEFVREKMRERLQDARLCDILIPKDYGFGTHRVPLENGFLEAFLRPNVEVVSVKDNPIECVTPNGLRLHGRHGAHVRRPDLRNRLRCGNRRTNTDGHPWPRRPFAEGGLGPRDPLHDGTAGARLSEPVHHRCAARALGSSVQHDDLPAAAGRVDQRLHPVHARDLVAWTGRAAP